MVKSLPAMWETQIWALGWEDLLEKEMATRSSILAWKIPWMKETGGLLSQGSQVSVMTEQLTHIFIEISSRFLNVLSYGYL